MAIGESHAVTSPRTQHTQPAVVKNSGSVAVAASLEALPATGHAVAENPGTGVGSAGTGGDDSAMLQRIQRMSADELKDFIAFLVRVWSWRQAKPQPNPLSKGPTHD